MMFIRLFQHLHRLKIMLRLKIFIIVILVTVLKDLLILVADLQIHFLIEPNQEKC